MKNKVLGYLPTLDVHSPNKGLNIAVSGSIFAYTFDQAYLRCRLLLLNKPCLINQLHRACIG